MNTLIADAGGNGIQWIGMDAHGEWGRYQSAPLHPTHMPLSQIGEALATWVGTQSLPPIHQLYFYSAGVLDRQIATGMNTQLQRAFPHAQIEVASDLLAAARSVCGHASGLVAILGTGSNTCWYDGHQCQIRRRGFGYILGDEGSGAVLGLQLVKAWLYDRLPVPIHRRFEEAFSLTADEVIERVYRQPQPNQFLSSFVPFVHQHLQNEFVQAMVKQHFQAFFHSMMTPYHELRKHPLHIVGSIGFYFASALQQQAEEAGYSIGRIVQSPLKGLLDYHQSII